MRARPLLKIIAVLCAAFLMAGAVGIQRAGACCATQFASETAGQVSAEHNQTRNHFGTHSPLTPGTGELGEHQRFLINYLFLGKDNIGGILPAWMLMSQQLTAVMMQQMWMVAEMIDAKHQLESHQLFREQVARTHKAYQPSMGMCIIGTNVRSLATAERHGRVAAFTFGQRVIDRQTGSKDTTASDGITQDRTDRLKQFKELYCDRNDNNRQGSKAGTGLDFMCNNAPPKTVNNDIDYTRTIELPRTFEMDVTAGGVTQDEKDIFSLSSNLFAHDIFSRITENELAILANHDDLQDMRSVIAKRSVVQNSFNSILGMKAQGSDGDDDSENGNSEDTSKYMRHLIRELGVTKDEELVHMLGDHGTEATGDDVKYRPSYYAQLEVLTKKIYQNPEFFTDLYDTPANIKRKGAALQAMNLVLDRDIYDSYLRSEILTSLLLELRLENAQRGVVTDLQRLNESERGPR